MKNSFAELNKIVEDLVFAVSQIHELPLIEKDLLMEQFRRVYAHIALCEEIQYEDDIETKPIEKEAIPTVENEKHEEVKEKPQHIETKPEPIEVHTEEQVKSDVNIADTPAEPIEEQKPIDKFEQPVNEAVEEKEPVTIENTVTEQTKQEPEEDKSDRYKKFVEAFEESNLLGKNNAQNVFNQNEKQENEPVVEKAPHKDVNKVIPEEVSNKTAEYIDRQFVEDQKPLAPETTVIETQETEPIIEPIEHQPDKLAVNVESHQHPVIQEQDLFSESMKPADSASVSAPQQETSIQTEPTPQETVKTPESQPEPYEEDDLLEFISQNKSQNQPQPTAPEQTSYTTHQTFNNKRSLNDLIHEHREDHSLSSQYQHAKVVDLTKAISINDKFTYIRELFKNRGEEFSAAIQQLNKCTNLEQAFDELERLKKHYYWDTTSNAYLSLCDLLRRKFA